MYLIIMEYYNNGLSSYCIDFRIWIGEKSAVLILHLYSWKTLVYFVLGLFKESEIK